MILPVLLLLQIPLLSAINTICPVWCKDTPGPDGKLVCATAEMLTNCSTALYNGVTDNPGRRTTAYNPDKSSTTYNPQTPYVPNHSNGPTRPTTTKYNTDARLLKEEIEVDYCYKFSSQNVVRGGKNYGSVEFARCDPTAACAEFLKGNEQQKTVDIPMAANGPQSVNKLTCCRGPCCPASGCETICRTDGKETECNPTFVETCKKSSSKWCVHSVDVGVSENGKHKADMLEVQACDEAFEGQCEKLMEGSSEKSQTFTIGPKEENGIKIKGMSVTCCKISSGIVHTMNAILLLFAMLVLIF